MAHIAPTVSYRQKAEQIAKARPKKFICSILNRLIKRSIHLCKLIAIRGGIHILEGLKLKKGEFFFRYGRLE